MELKNTLTDKINFLVYLWALKNKDDRKIRKDFN
jgi:hypothetical protein